MGINLTLSAEKYNAYLYNSKTYRNDNPCTTVSRGGVSTNQTTKMEPFAEKVNSLKANNYFSKSLHLRCLTGPNCTSGFSSQTLN